SQIKMRAERLGVRGERLYIYSETSVDSIVTQIEALKPAYVVLDSIQTLEDSAITSAPGSVSQVREITGRFLRIAKVLNITVFIVGHVTKEGSIAGPRVLEHMVDTVLYFEGERHLSYRILRAVKNRFGSTNEIGVFEMRESGLVEVENPSSAMLEGRPEDASGSAVTAAMEGTRPMMLELQALISKSSLNIPRRMCAGLDYNRVSLLIAVLEKRAGYRLSDCDAFINVVGGIKLNEPAADLAICAAIMSSFRNIPLPARAVFIGELGLTGEVRAVSHIDKRVSEALRLGFDRIYLPAGNRKNAALRDNGNLIFLDNVRDINCWGD
ncbi:MAG: DNA repair protein RadA, partial [Clostridia bacterium]|nr:DNA repair protein RadA [Clostridia bacterium]